MLLEGAGYNVRTLAHPFDGHLGQLLEGVQLLLLPRTFGPEAMSAWVDRIAEIPELDALLILALTSYGDAAPRIDGLAAYVPWPSRIAALLEHIVAASSGD